MACVVVVVYVTRGVRGVGARKMNGWLCVVWYVERVGCVMV